MAAISEKHAADTTIRASPDASPVPAAPFCAEPQTSAIPVRKSERTRRGYPFGSWQTASMLFPSGSSTNAP